ncbi:hypothetical protein ACFL0I_03435, partial [Gemmatimonadota bacterium]
RSGGPSKTRLLLFPGTQTVTNHSVQDRSRATPSSLALIKGREAKVREAAVPTLTFSLRAYAHKRMLRPAREPGVTIR